MSLCRDIPSFIKFGLFFTPGNLRCAGSAPLPIISGGNAPPSTALIATSVATSLMIVMNLLNALCVNLRTIWQLIALQIGDDALWPKQLEPAMDIFLTIRE